MARNAGDSEQPDRELDYYKRQLDEISGQNVKNDYLISGLRHELKQKRDGFSLLAELQQSFDIRTPLSAVFFPRPFEPSTRLWQWTDPSSSLRQPIRTSTSPSNGSAIHRFKPPGP
jgi:hypothetical protein